MVFKIGLASWWTALCTQPQTRSRRSLRPKASYYNGILQPVPGAE